MIATRFDRITRTYTQCIHAPLPEVFTLLCPVREAEWLEDFTYDMIYSKSGVAEEGCVFRTQIPGGPETVWIIVQHDREAGVIEFARVTAGMLATRLHLQLAEVKDEATAVRVTYTITPTSDEGASFAKAAHSEKAFLNSVKWWERSMNHFIATGQMLRKNEVAQ